MVSQRRERERPRRKHTNDHGQKDVCYILFFTSLSMHQFYLHDVIYLVLYSALIKADSMVLAQWLQRCHFSIFLQASKACEKESSRKAKVSHTARFTASFEGLFFTEQAPYGCLKSLNTRILLWWRFEKWLFFCVKCLKQLKTVPTWLLDTLWNMKLLYDSCLSFYLFKQSTKMSMHVMYTSSWS